jgi:hypothetical protein
MRYRGPYEYDKFTLNILNYVNFVNDYIFDMNNTSEEYLTFKQVKDDMHNAYEKAVSNMEIVYKEFIMNH